MFSIFTLALSQETNQGVLDRLRALNPLNAHADEELDAPELAAVPEYGTTMVKHAELGLPGNPCGGNMYVMDVRQETDSKVFGIDGDWMAGCQACGRFLETYRVNGFCGGWWCSIGYAGPFTTGVWLKRTGPCAGPAPSPPPAQPACTPVYSATGSWVPRASTSERIEYEITKGVTRSTSATDAHEWGAAAEVTVSAGFEAPAGPSASVSVSASVSAGFSNAYTEYFESSSEVEFTFFSDRAGQMWQWQFEIHDACGVNIVKGMDVVLTKNRALPPCCLPGHFNEPQNPGTTSCVASWGETTVYNLCKSTATLV